MIVELRFYKRYDADLLSLHETGASLSSLTKAAVIAYANGKRVRYMVPKCKNTSFEGRKTVRLHMTIDDPRTVELLSHIKNSYRNQFCKTVLRDALVTQCIGAYISSSYGLNAENGRLQEMMDSLPEDTIILNGKKKRISINDILKGSEAKERPRQTIKERKDIDKEIEKIKKNANGPKAAGKHEQDPEIIRSGKPEEEKITGDLYKLLQNDNDDEPEAPRFTTFKPEPKEKETDKSESNDADFMNMFESITNL